MDEEMIAPSVTAFRGRKYYDCSSTSDVHTPHRARLLTTRIGLFAAARVNHDGDSARPDERSGCFTQQSGQTTIYLQTAVHDGVYTPHPPPGPIFAGRYLDTSRNGVGRYPPPQKKTPAFPALEASRRELSEDPDRSVLLAPSWFVEQSSFGNPPHGGFDKHETVAPGIR